MPPKQRITREMILESSFAMFCQEGMEVVNARSVAKALNCSTQPIFSYYAGMDDLKTALHEKARALFESRIDQALQGEEPLFSVVTDATGVEQDDVGDLLRFGGRIAHLLQKPSDGLGIPYVHLAAVGFDIIGLAVA